MEHLHPKTREIISKDTDTRVRDILAPKWIGYGNARKALADMESLIQHPQTHRMPNLLIYGPTNNGKTMIVERFLKNHPPNDNPQGDAAEIPALSVQMPFTPDARRFYTAVLDSVFAPYRHTDNLSRLETQAIKILKSCGLKMLIIDELHNILAGRSDNRRQFLNLLRYLGNELRIPIVCLGLQSALRAIQIDEQLTNRFKPFALPCWSDGTEYRKLLNSFESILPLRHPSLLSSNELANTILAMSEGTIGEITTLLREAAIRAIQIGHERIDIPLLNEVDYIPPSKRRLAAQGTA